MLPIVAILIGTDFAIARSREPSISQRGQQRLVRDIFSSGYSSAFSAGPETSYRLDIKLDQSSGMLKSSVYPNEVRGADLVDIAEVQIPDSTLKEIIAAKDTEPAKAFKLLWPFFEAVFSAAKTVGQPIFSARLLESLGEAGTKSNDQIIEELRALMTKLHAKP
jgi:hypothetical protein